MSVKKGAVPASVPYAPNYGKRWVRVIYQFFDIRVEQELLEAAIKHYGASLAEARLHSETYERTLIFNGFKKDKDGSDFVEEARVILGEYHAMVSKECKGFIKIFKKQVDAFLKSAKKAGNKKAEFLEKKTIPWEPFVKMYVKE